MRSRNQLRLDRQKAERERPGTIQYEQAHQGPRVRAWMTRLNEDLLAPLLALLSAHRNVRVDAWRKDPNKVLRVRGER